MAYVYGMYAQNKAVIPIPPSLAEKQIKATKEAVAKKRAAVSKSKQEKQQGNSKSSQTSDVKEAPKADSPNNDKPLKNPGQEKVESKKKNDEPKAENHEDESHKKAKEDKPKKVPLTNEQLKLKLERYYKTGKLTESKPDIDEKVDYRLQRYFIRGGLDNFDRAKIWHEISLHDEGRKIYKEDKYSDLAKLPKDFSVEAIRKSYGEKTPIKAKNYAVLIEKVIKRPWYSRVFY